MEKRETHLEIAKKRLLEFEEIEAIQLNRILDMKRRGLDTTEEEKSLEVIQTATKIMREEYLEKLKLA